MYIYMNLCVHLYIYTCSYIIYTDTYVYDEISVPEKFEDKNCLL
jgi:hypothetical protein